MVDIYCMSAVLRTRIHYVLLFLEPFYQNCFLVRVDYQLQNWISMIVLLKKIALTILQHGNRQEKIENWRKKIWTQKLNRRKFCFSKKKFLPMTNKQIEYIIVLHSRNTIFTFPRPVHCVQSIKNIKWNIYIVIFNYGVSFNSYGTRRLYLRRDEVAVYCQDIYYGLPSCGKTRGLPSCGKTGLQSDKKVPSDNPEIFLPRAYSRW